MKEYKFNALNKKILIRKIEDPEKTESGIILKLDEKDEPWMGIIVEIGQNDLELRNGDTILFARWSGTELNFNKEKLLVITEEDVIAVLEEKEA